MDNKEEIVKRLRELSELIKKHNFNYHTLDKPKISDKEFDNNEENDLVSQLERLASLKERGLLTNKEFVEAKRRLLF